MRGENYLLPPPPDVFVYLYGKRAKTVSLLPPFYVCMYVRVCFMHYKNLISIYVSFLLFSFFLKRRKKEKKKKN